MARRELSTIEGTVRLHALCQIWGLPTYLAGVHANQDTKSGRVAVNQDSVMGAEEMLMRVAG